MGMYAKLMSRITESSLMEEAVPVRYVFMMMLAMADPQGYVIGTDVAIARRMNISVKELQDALVPLMSPDESSNSKEQEGRRVILSDCERGYYCVNYCKYRDTRNEEDRREYMRDYMRKRRSGNDVADVNSCKLSKPQLAQVEAEEKEGRSKKEEVGQTLSNDVKDRQTTTRKPAMLPDADWIAGLQRMDAYRGINIPAELQKAQVWCEAKRRKCSRPFFVNWVNRACADRAVVASPAVKPQKSRGQCIGEAGQRYALLENYNDWPKRADGTNQTPDEVGDADWKKQLPAL